MKKYPATVHDLECGVAVQITVPDSNGCVSVFQDVYGEKEEMCQLIVHSSEHEDPALHIRLNDDGSIAEVLVRPDLMDVVRLANTPVVSDWLKRRDGDV